MAICEGITAAQPVPSWTRSLAEHLRKRGFENLALWARGVDTNLFKPRPKSFLSGPRPVSMYTGKAATGTAQAMASSRTSPKVSVMLRKTNTSAAATCAAGLLAEFLSDESDVRVPGAQAVQIRPVPYHVPGSRQVEIQERLDVLFHRYPSHSPGRWTWFRTEKPVCWTKTFEPPSSAP